MVCLLSTGTVNELLCFYSFCFEDLFNCRNHPYDVSGERLTQYGFFLKVKNMENCLKKITDCVLFKSH